MRTMLCMGWVIVKNIYEQLELIGSEMFQNKILQPFLLIKENLHTPKRMQDDIKILIKHVIGNVRPHACTVIDSYFLLLDSSTVSHLFPSFCCLTASIESFHSYMSPNTSCGKPQ